MMSGEKEDKQLCKLTIVVITRTEATKINFDGEATLPALTSLQVSLTKLISSNFNAETSDDAVILQGQIVNSALRLAQMFGHAGERVISEG
jgi:hypothetical protein